MVLRATQQLVTLVLSSTEKFVGESGPTGVPSIIAPARLPFLRTLKLHSYKIRHPWFEPEDATRTALRYLRAPSLNEVSLKHADKEDICALRSLPTESGQASIIRTLSFDTPQDTDAVKALSELLPRLPSLQSLAVVSKSKPDVDFISLLSTLLWSPADEQAPRFCIESSGYSSICPELENISLQDLTVDFHLLQSAVQSRVYVSHSKDELGPARLRSVMLLNLKVTGDPPNKDGHRYLQWLQELEKDGLR